ncbi:PAS domain-containing sensor histidine kinase [Thiohalorhabdus sp. Cl-TMA]|uniref:histidine kinase n=1 Tax=Thiohalorhabdus methylotrophus TaxID=3242694 RepID=A0ABV4TQJ7_9GAMM
MRSKDPKAHSEEQLLYSNALLNAQLETSPDGILVADRHYRMLTWNRRFREMWGISEEVMAAGDGRAAVQRVLDQVVEPEPFRAEIKRLYEHLEEAETQVEITLKDGRVLERHSRGVQDERGSYWGRSWFYRDITEQKRAEKDLRVSEQRFRAVFERAALGIAVVDPEGHPWRVNPALERMLGRSAEELTSTSFLEVTHPEDRQADREAFEELVAGRRESYGMEKRYLTGDGRVVWGRLSASTLPGWNDQQRPWFLGMVEDVTENRELLEELRLLAQVFRAGNAVMITDALGRILRVNEGFCEVTGYRPEEVLGGTPGFLKSRFHGEEFYRALWKQLEQEGYWEGEIWNRRKDGSHYPQWQTITAVPDQSGRVARYVATFSDLTDRKLLESERQRRASSVGEMGRILAHQLNQPLAAIGSYVEGALQRLRREHPDLGELERGLREMRSQVERASGIVDDVRHYLRGERPELRPTDINSLLRSVLPARGPATTEPPCHFKLDLAADLADVPGDPIALQECLLNLVNNAVDAVRSNRGAEGRVAITTRRRGSEVEVVVRDNGPGIPPGLEEEIFRPLFTSKEEGTGLGLSICRSVVQKHGGRLWVGANEPGPGAAFHITLPSEAR